jgi:leader peptidase (prepilin peptidase)/N-methyltransferase
MLELLAANPTALLACAFGLGLLTGSFLNVVILRMPRRLDWQWKRDSRELLEIPEVYEPAPPGIVVESSHCPHCQHKLAAWENIPLISFLVLRGRCRHCQAAISWQYPLVEAATGLLFAACVWHFGYGWEAVGGMVFSAFLVALAGIDLRTTLLPDQLTLPLMWIGLLASLVTLYVDPVQAILGAAVGYLSLWSVYWLFKLLTGKEGMGYGDFKLLAAIVLISSLVGAVIGSIWLALKGRDHATPIPFGPYLAIAGWIQFIWGTQLLDAYLHWFKPG